ncbi:MAG: cytochrome c [Planctomycetales bacterium]
MHEKVISGGLPSGDEAFAELQDMGIKTIISVDGAKPDVGTAEKYGMQYVHLPHGYDGVPEERARELAKAVRDLKGPIYLHCHHGKHRSPAAAAVACIGAGLIGHDDGPKVLAIAGTSAAYRGLFQSVEAAHTFEKAFLDDLDVDFPPVAKLPAMAEAMIEIEHVDDRLKAIEQAGWKTPADQPALVPDHEALLLREHFTELLRTKELQAKPEKFRQLAQEAEKVSQALEDALKRPTTKPDAASKLFLAVNNNCKACHTAFRDIPLKEKGLK